MTEEEIKTNSRKFPDESITTIVRHRGMTFVKTVTVPQNPYYWDRTVAVVKVEVFRALHKIMKVVGQKEKKS